MADKLEPQKVLDAIENCSVEDQQIVLQYAYETIKQLMTDAVQVVHGHWEFGCGGSYNGILQVDLWDCSRCGESCGYKSKYCPNCGAKMDEECEQK